MYIIFHSPTSVLGATPVLLASLVLTLHGFSNLEQPWR